MGKYCSNCPKKHPINYYDQLLLKHLMAQSQNQNQTRSKPKHRSNRKMSRKIIPKDKVNNNHQIHHIYYGVNIKKDVPKPIEGDTFLNLISGEWNIYRYSEWTLIPNPGPRTYLGSTVPTLSVLNPKEGSLYFDGDGRIYIYQNNKWQIIPSLQNSNVIKIDNKKDDPKESKESKESKEPKESKEQIKIKEPIKEDIEEEEEEPEIKAPPPKPLVVKKKPIVDRIPNKNQIKIKSTEKVSLVEKNTKLYDNTEMTTATKSFEMQSTKMKIKMEINTNEYYHGKIGYELSENKFNFKIIPKGTQKIILSQINGMDFNLSICSWIQYTDSNGQSWQTVIGIADLTLYNDKMEEINEYNLENDDNKLTSLMDGKYLTSTAALLNIRITSPIKVSVASWTYTLLAYPNDGQFYLVKDFHDLEKQLNQSLPIVSISSSMKNLIDI
jgi:hypothetical protein